MNRLQNKLISLALSCAILGSTIGCAATQQGIVANDGRDQTGERVVIGVIALATSIFGSLAIQQINQWQTEGKNNEAKESLKDASVERLLGAYLYYDDTNPLLSQFVLDELGKKATFSDWASIYRAQTAPVSLRLAAKNRMAVLAASDTDLKIVMQVALQEGDEPLYNAVKAKLEQLANKAKS